jgi:hypothetical protein
MRVSEHSPERVEYYRGNEFSPIEGHNVIDDVATPQPQANVEAKPAEKEPVSQEREQQMETWMSNIKAFIRNIDISKL